jgi:predicted aspartyl protease
MAMPITEGAEMGNVFAEVEIFNHEDEGMVARRLLNASEVRHAINTVVDTGAMRVSIPEEEIAKLGLRVVRDAVRK